MNWRDPSILLFGIAVILFTGTLLVLLMHLRTARRKIKDEAAELKKLTHEKLLLSALIENCADFIGIADPDGKPIYVNPAGKRMVGLPADFPIERTQIHDYYPPHERDFAQNVIYREMVDKGLWQGETHFRNFQTEESIPVSDTHFMIYAPNSKTVLGMGTITRDITDRIARFKAETETKMKAEFLATMSHEIRTPLSIIIGYSKLLLDGKLPDSEQKKSIEALHRTAQQLLSLINDVLTLSKMEAGKSEPLEQAVNLPLLIQHLLAQFHPLAAEKGIALSVRAKQKLPSQIITDEMKLRQILANLLGNAIKYTNAGAVSIAVGWAADAGLTNDVGKLQFWIKDTGQGIPQAYRESIFEKFTSVSVTYSSHTDSTGLGLNLARQQAQSLKGDVILQASEIGKGSTFFADIATKVPETCRWLSPIEFEGPLSSQSALSGTKSPSLP